jgi:enterochelin esterase-like enzyme
MKSEASFIAACTFAISSAVADGPPAVSIGPGPSPAANEVALFFDRPEGSDYFVEWSEDLLEWTFLHRMWTGNNSRETLPLKIGNAARFFRLSGHPVSTHEWVTPAANTPRADYRIFWSKAAGRPVSYHVYLPPVYATMPDWRFPVLYWLHGSGAGVTGVAPLCRFFGDAIETGKIPPMIIVFPNGLPNGMWCDSKDGATPMESILIDDLIPHVDQALRTVATRDGRMIEGFSMGGYGAGRLGLKFADHFRAFSMFGAGPLQIDFLAIDPNLQPMPLRQMLFATVYGSDMNYYEAQTPWRLAEQRADSLPLPLSIRVILGDQDSMLENNRALHARFLDLGIAHEYRELPEIGHSPLQTLLGIGPANWAFYRSVFSEHPHTRQLDATAPN